MALKSDGIDRMGGEENIPLNPPSKGDCGRVVQGAGNLPPGFAGPPPTGDQDGVVQGAGNLPPGFAGPPPKGDQDVSQTVSQGGSNIPLNPPSKGDVTGIREGGPDVVMSFVLQRESVNASERTMRTVVVSERSRPVVWDWRNGGAIENIFLMSGFEDPGQVPLLDSHASYSTDHIRGSARGFEVVGQELMSTAHFSSDAISERSWILAQEGHLTDVSIGARLLEVLYVDPGESVVHDGVKYTAGELPLRLNLRWRPVELSLVVWGADGRAKIAGGRKADREQRSKQMEAWKKKLMVKLGFCPAGAEDAVYQSAFDALTAEQRGQFDAAVEQALLEPVVVQGGENIPLNPPSKGDLVGQSNGNVVDLDAVRQAAQVAERQRIAAIRAQAGTDVPESVIQGAIDEGLTVEQSSMRFLGAVRASRAGAVAPMVNTGAGRAEPGNPDVLAAALCEQAGVCWVEPNVPQDVRVEQERIAEQTRAYRGIGLLGMARVALQAAGQHVPHNNVDMVQQAFSTAGLANALAASVNKILTVRFMEAPNSAAGLAYVTEVPDYKLNTRVSVGKVATLRPAPVNTEAKHSTTGDEKETYAVARFAEQFQVDEITVVNDDLGAIMRVIQEMAAAAARLEPDLVYAILLANAALGSDSVALFHADHRNLGTTGTALSATTLQTAISAMAKQYKLEGKQKIPLNIAPRHLIVPQDLVFLANQLLTSAERIGSTNGDQGTRNVLQGLNIQIHADDRVGVNGVIHPETGTAYAGTATNYFLAADPTEIPTIEIAYLRGRRTPAVRQTPLTMGRFGVNFDIQHTIGGAALGYRGLYKATGAS
jgi:hypothetical protein